MCLFIYLQVEAPSDSGGRILHLRFNPLDNANRRHLEIFKELQEENDRLKKRIKVLEEEGAAATDVTIKVQQKLANEGSDSTIKSKKILVYLDLSNQLIFCLISHTPISSDFLIQLLILCLFIFKKNMLLLKDKN